MKVRISFVTDVDGNPDVARIGAVEDHPDEDAKQLIHSGVAAKATEQEIADYDQTVERKLGAERLDDLTKDELRGRLPDGVDVPANATKADLVAAVEDARRRSASKPEQPGPTTVAPGAEEAPAETPAQ